MFVPKVHFELIPIQNLVSSQEYQRGLSPSQVDNAAANFDLHQINPVKVSRRDGVNYVVNGQHTIEIVAQVSGSRECPVWCMIYDDLSYQHEADVFANQMKFVRPLRPYEIFMANIEAGNEKQLLIRDLVESYTERFQLLFRHLYHSLKGDGVNAVEGRKLLRQRIQLLKACTFIEVWFQIAEAAIVQDFLISDILGAFNAQLV